MMYKIVKAICQIFVTVHEKHVPDRDSDEHRLFLPLSNLLASHKCFNFDGFPIKSCMYYVSKMLAVR